MSDVKTKVIKTYVLLDHMLPVANNIHVRVNKHQRIPLKKTAAYRPFMKITITGKDFSNKTIRYKAYSGTIFQDDQMKNGIPANEKFITQEYRNLEFKSNVLTTDDEVIQAYVEAYPGFDGNENKSPDVPRKEYTLYDKASEVKQFNDLTEKRIKAGVKIYKMTVRDTQNLLYKIYGSAYVPSKDLGENRMALIEFLDESDEAIDIILKGEVTPDDEMTILVGKLLTAELISFTATSGQVSKKVADKWVDIKAIPDEFVIEERQRLFAEFLLSDAGELYLGDLEKDLEEFEKAAAVKEKK